MIKKSSLALILPCYNESASIPYFIDEYKSFALDFSAKFKDIEIFVVVVNNNSSDDSYSQLKLLENDESLNLKVANCETQGYGAALKHGFSLVKSDYLCFLDLDNTYPLNSLIEMFAVLKSQNLDIIFGARIHKTSKISFIRYLGNQFYVVLLKFLFNSKLTDVCSGMRLFKAQNKSEIISLKSNDLSFSIEFTSHILVNNWKCAEIPILYRDRIGESKLSVVKDGFLFLWSIIKSFVNKK
jgi:glycosyltransferase involved in cell wall biosynthesis